MRCFTTTLALILSAVFHSSSLELPENNCIRSIIVIAGGTSCSRVNQLDSQVNHTVRWQCPDLQSALLAAVDLSSDLAVPENSEQQNCTSLAVPPGVHLISSPAQFFSSNLNMFGTGESSDDVTIFCNYTVDVDESRIFDLNYSYTDYTFYFNRSEMVSFEGVQFVSCPYPLRLDTIATVRVANSTFR